MADLIIQAPNHGWHDGRRLGLSSCHLYRPFALTIHHRLSAQPFLRQSRQEGQNLFVAPEISRIQHYLPLRSRRECEETLEIVNGDEEQAVNFLEHLRLGQSIEAHAANELFSEGSDALYTAEHILDDQNSRSGDRVPLWPSSTASMELERGSMVEDETSYNREARKKSIRALRTLSVAVTLPPVTLRPRSPRPAWEHGQDRHRHQIYQ
ncbi:hypothetical protein BDR22DRAFT_125645 [Usnea florida]